MRSIAIFFAFVFFASYVQAQVGAQTTFKKTVALFLEEGGVIQKQSEIDRMPTSDRDERKEKADAQAQHDYLIELFKMPPTLSNFDVKPQYTYEAIPLSKLGSMVFQAKALGNDPKKIKDKRNADLLVADDYSQISLMNPSENTYQLNINLLSYMNWALSANVQAGYKEVIKSKLETAIQKTFQDKSNLNIAYGYFQNRLATLFKDVNQKERLESKKDFAPLFDIWLQYSTGGANIRNGNVIDGFNALLIQKTSDALFLGNNSANAMAGLNLDFSFLQLKSETEFSWKKDKELKKTVNTLDLYFNGEPNFVDIPTEQKILSTWKYMTNDQAKVIYEGSGNMLTVSDYLSGASVVKVLFGPLPSTDYKSDLSARLVAEGNPKPQYIQNVVLQDFNPTADDRPEEGLYYLPISIQFDREKIRTDANIKKNIVINQKFEVYYKRPCKINGKDEFLSITYPLYINLFTGPGLKINDVVPGSDISKQTWTIEVLTTEAIQDLELNKIDFNQPSLDLFAQELASKATISKDGTNPNKWIIKTESDLLETDPFYGKTIAATFSFSVAKKDGDVSSDRNSKTMTFPLRYKSPLKQGTEVVSSKIADLTQYMSDTVKVNGQKAKLLLQSKSTSDSTRNKIYDQLIQKGAIQKKDKSFTLKSGVKD